MKNIKIENLKMRDLLIRMILDSNFYDDDLKKEVKNHLNWSDIIEEIVEADGRIYIVFISGFKIELPLIKGNRSYNLFIDYSNNLESESSYFTKREVNYKVKCKCGMEYNIVCIEIKKDIVMAVNPGDMVRNEMSNFCHQRLYCCKCAHSYLFCHETPEKYARIKKVEFDFED